MKTKLLAFLMASFTALSACCLCNIPLYQTAHTDVYYPDTGWIEMGRSKSQTWYEYYVSLVQSGLHSPDSEGYKVGAYCMNHPELTNASADEIGAAVRAAGIIGAYNSNSQSQNNSQQQKNKQSEKADNKKVSEKVGTPKPNVTLNNYESVQTYVVTSKKAVYSTYEKGREEIGSITKGTEVNVKGESSNGFYLIDYTKEDGTVVDGYLLFDGKDNIVKKEDYDAAWAESERVEATCEKDGFVKYTNSLSGASYKEPIAATGHATSSKSKYDVVKPGLFKNGKTTVYCDKCGEVAETKAINSIYMDNSSLIIVAAISIVVILLGLFFLLIKKISQSKKRALVTE